jgi:hypothetical protein
LSIDEIEGEKVESITVYTADEEVTVEFGYWITHFGDLDAHQKLRSMSSNKRVTLSSNG